MVAVYDVAPQKEFLAEDKRSRRLPKKVKYPIVLFEPDDLHLVGSSTSESAELF